MKARNQIPPGRVSCEFCASGNQAGFPAEMIIHFSGFQNVDKPGVLVFPELWVCLDCGYSRFEVPETELALLAKAVTRSEASTG